MGHDTGDQSGHSDGHGDHDGHHGPEKPSFYHGEPEPRNWKDRIRLFSMDSWFAPHLRGDPNERLESKYDPLFGFPKGRKKRPVFATELEMDSGNIRAKYRDYCAHIMLQYMACRRDNKPFYSRCNGYRHNWEECTYQDNILRMKEYERERRLDLRQERILKTLKEQKKEELTN